MGKPAPTFWWKFNYDNGEKSIIVQSDYPGGQELARFTAPKATYLDHQIELAEKLIDDFVSGRKTPDWRK